MCNVNLLIRKYIVLKTYQRLIVNIPDIVYKKDEKKTAEVP
jgi:hypothetical protein